MKSSLFLTKALALGCALWGSAASATTVAYYRFEDGPVDTEMAVDQGGEGQVIDSSGNGSHFSGYPGWMPSGNTGPFFRSNVAAATIPQTGAANTLSAQLDGNDDIYDPNPTTSHLNNFSFSSFTVETYVNFTSLTGFQTMVGRDDTADVNEHDESFFYLQKTGSNNFRVSLTLADGSTRIAVTDGATIGADTWYHVAAVGDTSAGTLELFVDGVSVGLTTGFTGLYDPMVASNDNEWSIGRGEFQESGGDKLNGYLDEVRFSDVALSPDQFLSNIPEPSTYALLFGLSALTWVAIRRRKA